MDSLESSFRIVPAAIRPCGGGTLEIEVNDEEHNTVPTPSEKEWTLRKCVPN